MTQQVSFDVSEEEFRILLEKKGRTSWRELFLKPLGIETRRIKSGPRKDLQPAQ